MTGCVHLSGRGRWGAVDPIIGVLLTRSKGDLRPEGLGPQAGQSGLGGQGAAVARELSVILLRLWTDNSLLQPRANATTG